MLTRNVSLGVAAFCLAFSAVVFAAVLWEFATG